MYIMSLERSPENLDLDQDQEGAGMFSNIRDKYNLKKDVKSRTKIMALLNQKKYKDAADIIRNTPKRAIESIHWPAYNDFVNYLKTQGSSEKFLYDYVKKIQDDQFEEIKTDLSGISPTVTQQGGYEKMYAQNKMNYLKLRSL
jgi:hypothetical protein